VLVAVLPLALAPLTPFALAGLALAFGGLVGAGRIGVSQFKRPERPTKGGNEGSAPGANGRQGAGECIKTIGIHFWSPSRL